MTTSRLLTVAWSPDPSVVGGSLALLIAYVVWLRGRLTGRSAVFIAGVLVLVVALVSPIDRLGELYLFSVHMVQHMLLILVIPPMLLWGLPPRATRRLLDNAVVARLERLLGHPALTLPLKILVLWAWHLPVLYDAALQSESVHALEHLLFLVTATMFWWPVLTPVRRLRLSPPNAMMYLFGAMAGISILGMVITFAPQPLYPFYLNPPDPYGALSLIRNGWGLSALADQQYGGVLMWIVGGLFYIVCILTEFGIWFSAEEADHTPTAAVPQADPHALTPPARPSAPAAAGKTLEGAG